MGRVRPKHESKNHSLSITPKLRWGLLEFTVCLNKGIRGIQFSMDAGGSLRFSAIPEQFVGLIMEQVVVPFVSKLFLDDR
jgi:hypothetical protein